MHHLPLWLQHAMGWSITSGPLYWGVMAVVGVGLVVLAVDRLARRDVRALGVHVAAAAVAGAVGLLAAWLVSDVIMVFGVSLGWTVIGTVAAGFAALGFLAGAIRRTRRFARALAVLLVPLTVVACAMGVNAAYGEFRTVGSLVGYSPYRRIGGADGVDVRRAAMDVTRWRDLAARHRLPSMPSSGGIVSADIPATSSGFRARTALVYLPPAALSDEPPALPVLVMLAGQPGSPNRVFAASGIEAMLDAYAAEHDGLAPIVVVPDQNGASTVNSLCADTAKVGRAETYLIVDVPDWIRDTLPAAPSGAQWAIAGFSQGGTCATQLGPRHPDLFGTFIAVDGEEEPVAGSRQQTIDEYFGGDEAAYRAIVPADAITAHAPSDQTAVLSAGADDRTSVANVRIIGKAARKAGMDVTELAVRHAGHDWHAVNETLETALPWWCDRVGLAGDAGGSADGSSDSPWAGNEDLEVLG
ncbi:alpha/beta hydrolase [Bifidobacterium samirii]|uniref:Esterase n=1 Tax=Bifidobacterium samirii TaxID=2306974 RepID=A0A430FW35_9BIFI|nr:alpha/beta hydrolase-fold protein [Bifidobacterium samirii]RSX58142.1 esterase [Bifidobacterium samirii]